MTYLIQIDDVVRQATNAEAKIILDAHAEDELRETQLKAKATLKAELLQRLGITADEAALLLS